MVESVLEKWSKSCIFWKQAREVCNVLATKLHGNLPSTFICSILQWNLQSCRHFLYWIHPCSDTPKTCNVWCSSLDLFALSGHLAIGLRSKNTVHSNFSHTSWTCINGIRRILRNTSIQPVAFYVHYNGHLQQCPYLDINDSAMSIFGH